MFVLSISLIYAAFSFRLNASPVSDSANKIICNRLLKRSLDILLKLQHSPIEALLERSRSISRECSSSQGEVTDKFTTRSI